MATPNNPTTTTDRDVLFERVSILNHQYAQSWVGDLDRLTNGEFGKAASAPQRQALTESVASATQSGQYLEDAKQAYAANFSRGLFGRAGQKNVDAIIRGVQDSTPGLPGGEIGSLPPTGAGQDQDLRAAVATELDIQLTDVGNHSGPNGFSDFVTQQQPSTSPVGRVDNTAVGNTAGTAFPSTPSSPRAAAPASTKPAGMFAASMSAQLRTVASGGGTSTRTDTPASNPSQGPDQGMGL